jgi:hypothetical protein
MYYAKEGVPMGGKVPKWQNIIDEDCLGYLNTSQMADNF